MIPNTVYQTSLSSKASMPSFKFRPEDVASCDVEYVEPTRGITWNLAFDKQDATEYIGMTNGLDPSMRLGFPIQISTPTKRRDLNPLHILKSRASQNFEDTQDRVTLSIDLPADHDYEMVYRSEEHT